eukprot:gene707-8959_t
MKLFRKTNFLFQKQIILFPGQGFQYVGMGQNIYEKSKHIFDEANSVLNYDLTKLMFSGDLMELTKTSNSQPAILTLCYAIFKLHKNEFDIIASLGHSLGEYTSLVIGGSISFSEAIKLVHKRGKFMEEGVKENKFEMCALMPCNYDKAKELCLEAREKTNLVCDISSVNSASQIVISGDKEAIDYAVSIAKSKRIRKAIPLNVGAPFHSELMKYASNKLKPYLNNINWKESQFPIISNVTSKIMKREEIPELLESN